MPPQVRLTKDMIADAATELVRREGLGALNARSLAKELGCSTQPIFSNYASMADVKAAVLGRAYDMYAERVENEMKLAKYPPFKSSGMAYIRFAKDEPRLFSALFMRDRSNEPEDTKGIDSVTESVLQMIVKARGISYAEAQRIHLEMWIFVHGIAVMIATDYFAPPWELIPDMLTDVYMGIGTFKEENKK